MQQGGIGFDEGALFDAVLLSCGAQHGAATRVGVLRVEDGIVVRSGDGGLQVEVEGSVGLSREHEESYGILADAFQERTQVEEGSAAFRHLEGLSVLHQAHDLTRDDRKHGSRLLASIMAGFKGGLQA